MQFGGRNYVTGRAELVDKDELFAEQNVPAPIANGVFSSIRPYYGSSPHSLYIFARFRGHGSAMHHGMQM